MFRGFTSRAARLQVNILRVLLWILTRLIYRVRVVGRENIPAKGGALLVCNHTSLVDAGLLLFASPRLIRFVMLEDFYRHWLIFPFAKLFGAIPVSSKFRPRDMIQSLRAAEDAVRHGQVVCIFAEGEITRIGNLLPFRRGFERIMKHVDAPIIPVHLDGLWGSIFSFEQKLFLWKLPRTLWANITVSFGKPMPASASPTDVRRAVQELGTDAYFYRADHTRLLHRQFIRNARRKPFRFLMGDARVPHLTFGGALTKMIYLARRLRPHWEGQEMVGVLLPPSVGAALVNLAATTAGKVPVNLNYTASGEVIASCARQCDIRTVITSKAFLEKVPLQVPGNALYLEDVAAAPKLTEKLTALAMAWLLPARVLERKLGRTKSDIHELATIVFSSGSTGDPKGVMLSHFNIAANVDQCAQAFAVNRDDRFLGILPFFHSFGFTTMLWLPAGLGIGVAYHPNPLDAKVGDLVRDYRVTFLVSTPTFLQFYTRRVQADDFGSLQMVIAGAEKLPARVSDAFEDKFGVKPLEGYGCTECAPVVAVNTADFRAPGFRQIGFKRGKIGQAVVGVSIRIKDPETGEILGINQPGLLLVRGPNVMEGYLHRPDKTAEVLQDGWYNTGDIASVDEDGFIKIEDRLSRFSKIAGEMVPHLKIEEKLHDLAGINEKVFAVTSVPDEKKGERIVVLHSLDNGQLDDILRRFAECELPPLWKPKAAQFFRIDELPYLGSGKLDLYRLKQLAAEVSTQPVALAASAGD